MRDNPTYYDNLIHQPKELPTLPTITTENTNAKKMIKQLNNATSPIETMPQNPTYLDPRNNPTYNNNLTHQSNELPT